MTTPREQALADLRQAIDTLSERTRRAMLAGIASNTVITGAFADGHGVCPMVAAEREVAGARCMGFPEAWDRFTGVHGRWITRPATEYEVLQLRQQLEASLAARAEAVDTNGFAEAIAEHKASVEARRRRARRVSGGFAVDLAGAVDEHRAAARSRREREAVEVGLDWLFEETLVLPEDFGSEPAPEPAETVDFALEPAVLPAGRRGRSILK